MTRRQARNNSLDAASAHAIRVEREREDAAERRATGTIQARMRQFPMEEISRDKDRRVMHIIELMQRDEYRSTATCEELAVAWGLALPTVCSHAAEAGRILRLIGEPQKQATWCLAQLRLLIDSTDNEAAKIAAIRVMLDRQPQSMNRNETRYRMPPAEQVEMLMRELAEPGPEMAEALRRMGVALPLRRVVDTVTS